MVETLYIKAVLEFDFYCLLFIIFHLAQYSVVNNDHDAARESTGFQICAYPKGFFVISALFVCFVLVDVLSDSLFLFGLYLFRVYIACLFM